LDVLLFGFERSDELATSSSTRSAFKS
jgi:hypothetical protein